MTINDGFLAFDEQDQPVLVLPVKEDDGKFVHEYWDVKLVGSLNGTHIYRRGNYRSPISFEVGVPCYWIRGL